jgi:chromosomal replication initiation ATPase DnaA
LKENTQRRATLKNRIEDLENQILLLKKFAYYEQYFSKLKRKRNDYIVEMRRLLSREMYGEGLSKSDIGRVLCKDHSTIIHMLKTDGSTEVNKVVSANYKQWIKDEVYPHSIFILVPSYLHKSGNRTALSYKLVEL